MVLETSASAKIVRPYERRGTSMRELPAKIARSKELLSKKETIEFSQYNFEVDLHYGNLNDYQLWRVKQEIKNTVYDFKESFGLENPFCSFSKLYDSHRIYCSRDPSYLEKPPFYIDKSNIGKADGQHKFVVLLYDNWSDYHDYTKSSFDVSGHMALVNGEYIAFVPFDLRYGVLRHELAHSIIEYTSIDKKFELPELLNHQIVYYMMGHGIYQYHNNGIYNDAEYMKEYLRNSKFDVDENTYFTIEFFQEMYPGLINAIHYDREGYSSALEFFKAKFPNMVSHIPDSDKDLYEKYDKKLFNKIFENKVVKQKLLDFIKDKQTEKKYIDKVNNINAFRVIKGDHIGTSKETGEEYYEGIIVNNKDKIGTFSPMEYSYLSNEIKVFNHANKDAVIIPEKYHNLKLVKVDSNFKLSFCDEHGNEYRYTKECKDKTDDLTYTDDAQKAFTLVDLYSIKGMTGQTENLGKIFSLKSENLRFLSIYDGNQKIGSFTNEVGYVNRNKFHFKDDHSTNFKTYDKNRALVTIKKESGEYQLSLRDGQYITDDREFQAQSIQLSGDNIDYTYTIKSGKISTRQSFTIEDQKIDKLTSAQGISTEHSMPLRYIQTLVRSSTEHKDLIPDQPSGNGQQSTALLVALAFIPGLIFIAFIVACYYVYKKRNNDKVRTEIETVDLVSVSDRSRQNGCP